MQDSSKVDKDDWGQAVWKEHTNLSLLSFPSSAQPGELLGPVDGDDGDMPAFDTQIDFESQPKPSQTHVLMNGPIPYNTTSPSRAFGVSDDGLKMGKIFWFIGDGHPAAAGFKERRHVVDQNASNVPLCVGCSSSSSQTGVPIYARPEAEIPDADLSTVQFSTRQQRLDWRDFLCEIVATSQVSSLFTLFDVEADPPVYAKPPPSQPAWSCPSRDDAKVDSGDLSDNPTVDASVESVQDGSNGGGSPRSVPPGSPATPVVGRSPL
mmetsp:Transcript_74985/g.139924  ORF Transcript_74985/g.139924 Transcript_74985/m.139924 type:complete len:265 (+) Transcript_74985:148-942(+)